MKLSEKIYSCRKKAGLSQEALAQKLGVSRQTISKWELGDAAPEPAKLKLLAQTFQVSVDWLLSEEEGEYTPPTTPQPHLGNLGRLVRRYGWLAGLYLVFIGVGAVVVGTLARYSVRQMFQGPMGLEGEMTPALSQLINHDPVSLMGSGIRIVGVVLVVAGIILAVVLKRRSKK